MSIAYLIILMVSYIAGNRIEWPRAMGILTILLAIDVLLVVFCILFTGVQGS